MTDRRENRSEFGIVWSASYCVCVRACACGGGGIPPSSLINVTSALRLEMMHFPIRRYFRGNTCRSAHDSYKLKMINGRCKNKVVAVIATVL